jgi:flagellar export protein FliJ
VSAIATVARVARLRERAARARFAATSSQARDAAALLSRESAHLADVSLPDSAMADGNAFAGWQAGSQLRAGAVRDASRSVEQTSAAREAALVDWQDRSRRREALDDVLLRWKAAKRAEADAAGQRLMDDLGSRRKEWS